MASGGPGNNRPYSLSKDEQLARMLQDEEYNAVHHEDEQLARQLQRNMMFGGEDGSGTNRSTGSIRQPLRTMTPISQLFSTLVSASLERHPRQTRRQLGLLQLSSDEEGNNDSDHSDSTVEDDADQNTARPYVSTLGGRGRGASRGTTRGRLGYRPTETTVHMSSTTPTETTPRSMFSVGSENPTSRASNPVRSRPPRGTGTRGTRRGATARRTSNSSTTTQSTETQPSVSTTPSRPPGRSLPPRSMEPAVPPLSLAINQPVLPDGEVEPEFMILDRGSGTNDGPFLHIMRDPMLLLLFLMGRSPHLMVPDDIDPTDYEALWDLAERLGEVKNRGLNDDELKKLSIKKFTGKTKFNEKGAQCQVCLCEYKSGDSLVNLQCKHEFHDKCIKEWLKRNASCPICRFDVKKEKS